MPLLFASMLAVSALHWIDTTGHRRTEAAADSDYESCVNGIALFDFAPDATQDQIDAAYRRARIECMAQHGWVPAKPHRPAAPK